MNFAIVDDDKLFAQHLTSRIEAICADNGLDSSVEYFENPDSILADDMFSKFHIIFMDIEMPGMNGIEATKEINRLRTSETIPYIVFVTAQDGLVFDALREFPYSFIRKSCLDDLGECILHISRRVSSTPTYSVKKGRGVSVLQVSRIIYLEKQGNYVNFHTMDGVIQERSSIDKKYSDLSHHGFLRPHIGCLVNAAHITELKSTCVVLSDGTQINLSRGYKKEFKNRFQHWMVRLR